MEDDHADGFTADFENAKYQLEKGDGAGNTFKATAKPVLIGTAVVGATTMVFGIIMMLNLGIGLVTPPVGSVLFVGAAVGKIPVETAIRTIWPFYGALILALLVITFVPAVSLTLPNLFG